MRTWMKVSVGIVIVVGAGAGVAGYVAPPTSAKTPEPPPPVPVVTAPVQQGDVPIILGGLGTVQAMNTAVIRAQVSGLLQSVDFTEGQNVKRGDLLAQIDPRPQQARLSQAEAQLARDQQQLSNTGVNLNRNLPLLSKGFATDQQVTDQKSQVAELQNTVKSDEAAVQDAQTQLSYTSLVAPFDGVTGIRTLDVGNVINPGNTTGLVTVTQVHPIAVVMTLPTKNIPDVQAALAAGPVGAAVFDQAGDKQLDEGKLLLINNQANANSGTVQLKAIFPNLKRQLWPGTFVNVQLAVRTVRNGLTVPTNALQQGADGQTVFVVGPDNKVSSQKVEVEQRERGVALVSQGLKPGQTVVVQGQYRLADGTEVKPSKPSQVADESAATSGMLP